MLEESSSFKEVLIELHAEALKLSREYRKVESDLVRVLNEIDLAGVYRVLGFSSLYTYVVSALGLSESVAYTLITVVGKACEIEALGEALVQGRITVARASRIARALSLENADELISFAATHTQRETDREVARLMDQTEA